MLIESRLIYAKGKEILLRNATEDDAGMLIDFLRTTCGETRFLAKAPEEIKFTVEQEANFIKQNNDSPSNTLLLAFWGDDYVGNCSLMGMLPNRYKHRATIGIALYQKYTNMGIGRAMLEALISIARQINLEQLELEVVCDNENAVHLYKSMGFEICGTSPHNMKYSDGTYADAYRMVKML